MEERTEFLPTIVDGSVGLLCDFLAGNPSPTIRWYADGILVGEFVSSSRAILYVENGRYLYIQKLTAIQRSRQYYCEARNLLLNNTIMRSPTTYDLAVDLPIGGFWLYKEFGVIEAEVGILAISIYIGAARRNDGTQTDVIASCGTPDAFNGMLAVEGGTRLRVIADGHGPSVNFTCGVISIGLPGALAHVRIIIVRKFSTRLVPSPHILKT